MDNRTGAINLRLFGALEVRIAGQSLVTSLAKKDLWLLTILALRQGKALPRDTLAGLLWPDTAEEQALYNLRRSLNRLREFLGHAAGCIEAIKPRSLLLSEADVAVDVHEFDRLAASTTTEHLAQAVALYRAPLLQDCFEEWILIERTPREFAYLRALNSLTNHALDLRDWNQAECYCRLQIAADPLQEAAYRTLMQALAGGGNHAAVVLVYRDLRLRLREEVNSEPDPATCALFEQIRRESRQIADTPTGASHSASAATRNMKSAIVGAAADLVAPAEPAAGSNRLFLVPAPLTRLIGRVDEIQTLSAHLHSSRLVTLLGAGGVGKTRLAIELAHRQQERFVDGVACVELASLTDPELVPQALAQALQITGQGGGRLRMQLCEALHDRRLLLILDNCEHLLEATAQLGRSLLESCSELHILATSRQALGVPGEIAWSLAPLPMPPVISRGLQQQAKADASEILEYASVQLFLERARQASPEIRIGPRDLEAIRSICQRLDGIPLALELAACRVRALSLEQIALRLDDRFRLLSGGLRTSQAHHRTLRGLLDWSYSLLDNDERVVFARLSVFVGGWTMEGAEAVCCADDVLDCLTSLVDKSLVIVLRVAGKVRYSMLETIREYARERLQESGERELVEERHRDYYVGLVNQIDAIYRSPRQVECLDRLEAEHDNLRAVLKYPWIGAKQREVRLRFASQQVWFWNLRGHWQEGLARLLQAMDEADDDIALKVRVVALNNAAIMALNLLDREVGIRLMERCVELCRGLGEPARLALAMRNLGAALVEFGDLVRGREYLDEALLLGVECNDHRLQLMVFLSLQVYAMTSGDCAAGLLFSTRALELAVELDDRIQELVVHGNRASLLLQAGEIEAARLSVERSLALSRDHRTSHHEILFLPVLCRIELQQGNLASARDCYRRVMLLLQGSTLAPSLVETLERILPLCLANGHQEQAVRLLGCASSLRTRLGLAHAPLYKADFDSDVAALQGQMDPEAFDRVWQEGEKLTPEQAIELALAETTSGTTGN